MGDFILSVDPLACEYMAGHFEKLAGINKRAAASLLAELITDIKSLEKGPYNNMPYNGPYLPIGKYAYVLSSKSKRYKIVYQIDGRNIFIDGIIDCREIK